MNSILLTLDSIPSNVAKAVDSYASCIHTANTNTDDVKIVLTICLTILITAVIVAIVIIKWQNNHFNQEIELEKARFDNNEAIKTNEFELYKERQDYDRDHKSSDQSSDTNRDEALNILKEIVQLTKDRNGTANEDFAKGLFDLYLSIKESKETKQK